MRLLATHVVHHATEDKYIRLYHGDLTAIPAGEGVDLLVVSAFSEDYTPSTSSLIGALHRKGISVHQLSRDKEVDLRGAFSCWLSRSLPETGPEAGFRRILCFETPGHASAPMAVGDIFRAIMPFALGDSPIRSIAIPVLAAGDQGYDATVMLRALFEAATHWLGAGLPVQTIKIVIYKVVLVDQLREAFAQLGATQGKLPERSSPGVRRQDSYHFFMSYAHDDGLKVDVLVNGLKRASSGLNVFVDKLALNPGASWQVELDRALESCRRVIPVYTPSYLKSKMCIEEFNMARLRHRQSQTPVLTPVYLRDADPLPLYMQTVQYLDCRPGDDDSLLLKTSATLAAIPFT